MREFVEAKLHMDNVAHVFNTDDKLENILLGRRTSGGKYEDAEEIGDICPPDYSTKLSVKIADFGAAFFCGGPESRITRPSPYTPSYCCPEYRKTRECTKRTAVHNFGVMLLRVFAGISPMYESTSQDVRHSADLLRASSIDSRAKRYIYEELYNYGTPKHVCQSLYDLCLHCLDWERHRYNFNEVKICLDAIERKLPTSSRLRTMTTSVMKQHLQ